MTAPSPPSAQPSPSPSRQPHPSGHLATLRESQDRALAREGIPMYLTLVSEVGLLPDAAGAGAPAADGAQIAARCDDYRANLLPSARDGDMGAVVSVLQAVAYADLFPGVAP